MIYEWANQHTIPAAALQDLLARLGALAVDPPVKSGESEAAIQTRVRIAASRAGGRLWRNNVGGTMTDTGQFLRYGLANESSAVNKRIKSSDLIGCMPVLIESHMVGTVLGRFTALEVKASNWKYRATERELAQAAFLNIVNALGGIGKFTTGEL